MEPTTPDTLGPIAYIFDLIGSYGITTTITGGALIAAWYYRKEIWATVKTGATDSIKRMLYEERIKQLENELVKEREDKEAWREKFERALSDERKRCDEEISAMRKEYEQRIDDLRDSILALTKTTTERISKLEASLQRNMHKSRGK